MPRRTRARQLATALTLLGIGLIVWGWVREGTTGYLPAMLLEIGATLALFAPLAYIGIGFERRVTAVQEATEELGGRVEEVRDEVRRALRLGELDDQIAERL